MKPAPTLCYRLKTGQFVYKELNTLEKWQMRYKTFEIICSVQKCCIGYIQNKTVSGQMP